MELTDDTLGAIEAACRDGYPADAVMKQLVAEVRSLRARIAAADDLHHAFDILDVDDTCEDCNNSRHGFEGEGGDWLCPDQYVATACCTCRDTDGDPQTWPCPTHTALHPEGDQ